MVHVVHLCRIFTHNKIKSFIIVKIWRAFKRLALSEIQNWKKNLYSNTHQWFCRIKEITKLHLCWKYTTMQNFESLYAPNTNLAELSGGTKKIKGMRVVSTTAGITCSQLKIHATTRKRCTASGVTGPGGGGTLQSRPERYPSPSWVVGGGVP